jgi:hypothetical protein
MALLVEALCCKPDGRGLDYQRGHWIFLIDLRGGSRIGTVELQHPLLPLDIIDNINKK